MAYTDENPWTRTEYKGKDAEPVTVKYKRPYSWHNFDNYLFERRITSQLNAYKSNRNGWYPDYKPVIERIDAYIRDHKLTGAYLGFFNPQVALCELGLNKAEMNLPPGGAQVIVLNLGGGIDPTTGLPAPEPEVIRAIQDDTPKDYYIDFEEVPTQLNDLLG